MIKKIKHTLLLSMVIASSILAGCSLSYFDDTSKKKVLVVFSCDKHRYKYADIEGIITKAFRDNGIGRTTDLKYVYLQSEMYDESHEIERARKIVSANQDADMMVLIGDEVHYSILKTENPFIYQVPIIISDVSYPNEKLIAKHTNVTGFSDPGDMAENIRVATKLTAVRAAFTVLDSTFIDKKTRQLMNEQLKNAPDIINNLNWDYSVNELLGEKRDSMSLTPMSLRYLNTNTKQTEEPGVGIRNNLVLTIRRFKDMVYIQMKDDGSWIHLARQTNYYPMITAKSRYFGGPNSSYLGGYFASEESKADEIAKCAKAIFDGTPPAQIPIQQSKKDYYIDWKVANKSGFNKDNLPSGYNVVNMTWGDKNPIAYEILTYGSVVLLVLFVLTSIIMFWKERMQKWNAMKKAERENELFNMVVEESNAFAWECVDGYCSFSDSFWKYVGQKPHSISLADFEKSIHPDFEEEYKLRRMQVAAGQHASVETLADLDNDGVYHWYQIKARGVLDDRGIFERSYGMIINIDDFKERESKLEEARQLAEGAKLKEAFLANMSHEIRTPLNAICGFSELLVEGHDTYSDEEKREFVDTIRTNNELLLRLINDILDLSRVESGQMEFRIEPMKASEVMTTIYNSSNIQVPSNLEYRFVTPDYDAIIDVDLNRLQQVLSNFIINASKFTSEGSITLGWGYDDDTRMVELYVEDTGIGLSEEDQKKIFNRFFKKNEFRQGTGLGLSICQAIVERLNGSIKVKSQLGKGSRFSVLLNAKLLK